MLEKSLCEAQSLEKTLEKSLGDAQPLEKALENTIGNNAKTSVST